MRVRLARAAGILALIGVVWWLASRLTWSAIGCEAYGCLPYSLGAQVVLGAGLTAVAAVLLDALAVRPGGWTAVAAAVALLLVWAAGVVLPGTTRPVVALAGTSAAFALAGAVGAFVTAGQVRAAWRVLAMFVMVALPPMVFAAAARLNDL